LPLALIVLIASVMILPQAGGLAYLITVQRGSLGGSRERTGCIEWSNY
jgi:hypothetical protein